MSSAQNLFDGLPTNLPEEMVQTLREAPGMRIERIVSSGHASSEGFWYDQPRHEFVVVLRGAARLRFEDGEELIELTAGSYLDIPAHRRHRVEWTDPNEPTIWLAVHYGD
jgi:cupin 2 domain-containing protein